MLAIFLLRAVCPSLWRRRDSSLVHQATSCCENGPRNGIMREQIPGRQVERRKEAQLAGLEREFMERGVERLWVLPCMYACVHTHTNSVCSPPCFPLSHPEMQWPFQTSTLLETSSSPLPPSPSLLLANSLTSCLPFPWALTQPSDSRFTELPTAGPRCFSFLLPATEAPPFVFSKSVPSSAPRFSGAC